MGDGGLNKVACVKEREFEMAYIAAFPWPMPSSER